MGCESETRKRIAMIEEHVRFIRNVATLVAILIFVLVLTMIFKG